MLTVQCHRLASLNFTADLCVCLRWQIMRRWTEMEQNQSWQHVGNVNLCSLCSTPHPMGRFSKEILGARERIYNCFWVWAVACRQERGGWAAITLINPSDCLLSGTLRESFLLNFWPPPCSLHVMWHLKAPNLSQFRGQGLAVLSVEE